MQLRFRRADWEFIRPFRISYRTRTHAQTVVAQIESDGMIGRGEALGVSYRGETVESVLDELAAFAKQITLDVDRTTLQSMLQPGGARNAVDCALWDLEAKRQRTRAWHIAGLSVMRPLTTSFTLGIDAPEAMADAAAAAHRYPVLKLKMNGDADLERVTKVRAARPDAVLLVDANQAWSFRQLERIAPSLARLDVKLIEQPLPAGADDELATYRGPIPLCADESCQTRQSLPSVEGKYQFINIKLDKTGGLTEALLLADEASARGLRLMVGCMGGSSLSMAPAQVVGQRCELVDLDSPLLIKSDLEHAIRYDGPHMSPCGPALWG